MTRLRLILMCALAALGLAASAPAPRGCSSQLGPVWGPALCSAEGLATVWSVMDLREPHDLAAERSQFDARLANCIHGRDARALGDRAAAFACVRNRVWARTRALSVRVDPQTFTGRWVLQAEGVRGEARVLAIAPNQVAVDLRTVTRKRGHTCALHLDAAWSSEAEVAWKGIIEPGHSQAECDVSLRRIGADSLRLDSTSKCTWICGASGEYRGIYRLQP
ncbi:MAG: hypothetical protein EBZ50_13935 [Alphaproteobacteria bacterium]|nr:hypothetical protein [Alphaproteobacteria bacterium]